MQFRNDGYFKKDNLTPPINATQQAPKDEFGNPISPDESLNFTPQEIGTTTNPMGNTIESLKTRIKEGTARIEFSFLGQGKGNSQRPTPESYGTDERRDIRELLEVNQMKTSTHAAVHSQSLAGFSNEGFNDQARGQALNEIKKAIDFASEATKGGAIVFHVQEWFRPISEIKDDKLTFEGYDQEKEKAIKYAIDAKTGRPIGQIRKDDVIYRPQYLRGKEYKQQNNSRYDVDGNEIQDDDFISVQGKRISKNESETSKLFRRVPKFNKQDARFEVEEYNWERLEREAKEKGIEPEVLHARIQLENQALSARGNSLMYAKDYEAAKEQYEDIREKKELYETLKKQVKPGEEYKLDPLVPERVRGKLSPEDYFERAERESANRLRHIHEASSSQDVRAKEMEQKIKKIKTVEEYGLQQTAKTISDAALYAMEKTKHHEKNAMGLEDPIYVAPENWEEKMYGSHPDEYKKIIDKSRETFIKKLKKKGYGEKEATEKAETHIRGTLDIGHLNLFRKHHYNEDKTPEQNEKDFEDWLIRKTEELVDEGYVGHIHLADNFGFDDEHLTPGQGNIPMKRFLKSMQERGMDDLIVEPGSFNIKTAVPDTLSMTQSPIYGTNRTVRFNQMRNQHYGRRNPGFFIAGAYSPSNEWKLWSDTPLE